MADKITGPSSPIRDGHIFDELAKCNGDMIFCFKVYDYHVRKTMANELKNINQAVANMFD